MKSIGEPGDQLVVVFDGECGMCSRLVRWLLRRDRRERLRFVSSASPKADSILRCHGLSAETLGETILVVRAFGGPQEEALQQSTAVVAVLEQLPRPWPVVAMALKWVPRALRDRAYRLIARNRYRIWGRVLSCPLPPVTGRTRFL